MEMLNPEEIIFKNKDGRILPVTQKMVGKIEGKEMYIEVLPLTNEEIEDLFKKINDPEAMDTDSFIQSRIISPVFTKEQLKFTPAIIKDNLMKTIMIASKIPLSSLTFGFKQE